MKRSVSPIKVNDASKEAVDKSLSTAGNPILQEPAFTPTNSDTGRLFDDYARQAVDTQMVSSANNPEERQKMADDVAKLATFIKTETSFTDDVTLSAFESQTGQSSNEESVTQERLSALPDTLAQALVETGFSIDTPEGKSLVSAFLKSHSTALIMRIGDEQDFDDYLDKMQRFDTDGLLTLLPQLDLLNDKGVDLLTPIVVGTSEGALDDYEAGQRLEKTVHVMRTLQLLRHNQVESSQTPRISFDNPTSLEDLKAYLDGMTGTDRQKSVHQVGQLAFLIAPRDLEPQAVLDAMGIAELTPEEVMTLSTVNLDPVKAKDSLERAKNVAAKIDFSEAVSLEASVNMATTVDQLMKPFEIKLHARFQSGHIGSIDQFKNNLRAGADYINPKSGEKSPIMGDPVKRQKLMSTLTSGTLKKSDTPEKVAAKRRKVVKKLAPGLDMAIKYSLIQNMEDKNRSFAPGIKSDPAFIQSTAKAVERDFGLPKDSWVSMQGFVTDYAMAISDGPEKGLPVLKSWINDIPLSADDEKAIASSQQLSKTLNSELEASGSDVRIDTVDIRGGLMDQVFDSLDAVDGESAFVSFSSERYQAAHTEGLAELAFGAGALGATTVSAEVKVTNTDDIVVRRDKGKYSLEFDAHFSNSIGAKISTFMGMGEVRVMGGVGSGRGAVYEFESAESAKAFLKKVVDPNADTPSVNALNEASDAKATTSKSKSKELSVSMGLPLGESLVGSIERYAELAKKSEVRTQTRQNDLEVVTKKTQMQVYQVNRGIGGEIQSGLEVRNHERGFEKSSSITTKKTQLEARAKDENQTLKGVKTQTEISFEGVHTRIKQQVIARYLKSTGLELRQSLPEDLSAYNRLEITSRPSQPGKTDSVITSVVLHQDELVREASTEKNYLFLETGSSQAIKASGNQAITLF